jgi:catechol 2,3-dioxygenase-like lactoylglutathione lyase family enzyme
MKLRPIHFVPDLDEALRFYGALGFEPTVRSRSGHWVELPASGGELALHDGAVADDGEGREGFAINFIAEEPLEEIERRLRAAGFRPEGTIVDQEWGRCLMVSAPGGARLQIDEPDRELYA